MREQYYLYAIKDPDDIEENRIYIGITTDVTRRMAQHSKRSHNGKVNKWFDALRKLGKKPCYTTKAIGPDGDRARYEELMAIRNFYEWGFTVLNTQGLSRADYSDIRLRRKVMWQLHDLWLNYHRNTGDYTTFSDIIEALIEQATNNQEVEE